jgi:aryl-alcohol dehydrogenase-like predicted oxidoreductase
MRYKLLGRSGLRVSELCLGTMTFGETWGWGASREECRALFDTFVAAGGNFIDTANNYTDGTSEQYVGELIAPDRERFVVATKYSLSARKDDPNAGGNHRKNMVQAVEASLRRLQTDYIDLYWLHMWDFTTPVEEVMRGLDDLTRSGKVLYVGISDTPAWVVSQANMLAELRGWSRFVALQLPYSLVDRDPERDLLPMARALDLAVTPWGIMDGGVLTGKYNRDTGEPTRYGRDDVSAKRLALVEEIIKIAADLDRSPAQVAINWVRQQQQRAQIIPIVGARTASHLRDNLACLEFELAEEHLRRLDALTAIKPGFPHDFLASDHVRGLIFGETFALIDNHHRF